MFDAQRILGALISDGMSGGGGGVRHSQRRHDRDRGVFDRDRRNDDDYRSRDEGMFDGIGTGTAIAGAAGLAAAGGLAYMAYQHFSQPAAPGMQGAPGVPGMPPAQAQPGFFQQILGSGSGPIPPGGAPAMGAGPGYPGAAMPGLPQGGGMPNYGVPAYHNDPSTWGSSAAPRQPQQQWGGAPNQPPQGGAPQQQQWGGPATAPPQQWGGAPNAAPPQAPPQQWGAPPNAAPPQAPPQQWGAPPNAAPPQAPPDAVAPQPLPQQSPAAPPPQAFVAPNDAPAAPAMPPIPLPVAVSDVAAPAPPQVAPAIAAPPPVENLAPPAPPPADVAPAAPPAPSPEAQADALLLIRAMITAAFIDGQIDAEERARIMGRLAAAGLSADEQAALAREFDAPQPPFALVGQIRSPQMAEQFYLVSVLSAGTESEAERSYLKGLPPMLGLRSEDVVRLHQTVGIPPIA